MRKLLSILFAVVAFSLPFSALADVSDYLGKDTDPSKCPKVVVIRPELSDKNVFVQVPPSDLERASQMIAMAIANKYDGSRVINAEEFDRYRACQSPVLLPKFKSYNTDSAIFGQHQGKASISVLRFKSPTASSPDKTIDISATGEREWGDSAPFMNAIKALTDKIQKTSIL